MSDDPELLAWLRTPVAHGLSAGETVDVIETPGARVFLAGDRALKVKRPVDLGFLNFSTLELRQTLTALELELNQPTAPKHYLRVVEICRDDAGQFSFGGAGDVVEVGLLMVRFDQDDLLSAVADRGELTDALGEALGAEVAAFHLAAPRSDISGTTSIRRHAGVNAGSLRDNPDVFAPGDVERLIAATEAEIVVRADVLDARGAAGWVRRVHGDLHLANIFLDDGVPTLFDAIEFDDKLATLDVLMDLAFLLMDMCHRGQARAANRALNVWLDRMARGGGEAGAYDGLAILPLCLSGRAAVRAHVNARLSKSASDASVRDEAGVAARAYMAEAFA